MSWLTAIFFLYLLVALDVAIITHRTGEKLRYPVFRGLMWPFALIEKIKELW